MIAATSTQMAAVAAGPVATGRSPTASGDSRRTSSRDSTHGSVTTARYRERWVTRWRRKSAAAARAAAAGAGEARTGAHHRHAALHAQRGVGRPDDAARRRVVDRCHRRGARLHLVGEVAGRRHRLGVERHLGAARGHGQGLLHARQRGLQALADREDRELGALVGGEVLHRQAPEQVVHHRGGEADLRVVGHPRRLEAHVRERLDERAQRHAVLQPVGDRLGKGVHDAGERRALLGHREEHLAGTTVVVLADGDEALAVGDAELERAPAPALRQLLAHRAVDDLLDDPLDHALDRAQPACQPRRPPWRWGRWAGRPCSCRGRSPPT